MKKALYELQGVGRNYRIGTLLNGQSIPHEGEEAKCLCPGVDYSKHFFPDKWHACLGFGGLAGGFHQGCEPGQFEPWRLTVMEDPDEAGQNILECIGGTPERKGKWALSKWFDDYELVYWASGNGVRFEWAIMWMGDDGDIPYVNGEGRGGLNVVVDKNEAGEGIGVHMMQNKLMIAFWKDAVAGSRVHEKRREIKTEVGEFEWLPKVWYRVNVEMNPIPTMRYTWQTNVEIRTPRSVVYSWASTEGDHPNNLDFLSQFVLADERQRDTWGGRVRVRRSMSWKIIPDELKRSKVRS